MNAPDEAAIFAAAFNRLRRRFLLAADDETAGDYYAYLSATLTLDEMLTAMGGLWATREFFPKPADFVLAFAPLDWRAVQDCVEHWNRNGGEDRKALLERVSPRGMAAARALGGFTAMREQGDVLRLKAAWEREYANAVQTEAMALPGLLDARALPGRRGELGAGRKLIGGAQ